MLTDKLRPFHDAVNVAVAKHGRNPAAVADDVIRKVFPSTIAAAEEEGADKMFRNGVIAKIKRMFSNGPDPEQRDFGDYDPRFLPIIKQLHSHSHFVPSASEYVHVSDLIAEPDLLDEARKFKRQKGEETIAEADILDQLYRAVTAA
jgi:hypothetical protein